MSHAALQPEPIPAAGDLGVIVRAAELCNPFLDALGEITLVPRGPLASSVLRWNDSVFRPVIRPLMAEVRREAARGGSFEVSAIDCRLDAALARPLAMQSRDAGRRLIAGLLPPRGDRITQRYRTAVLAGDSPGHLAVMHALRAALFSLPPRVMEGAYLLQEGMGAGLDGREISRFLIGGILSAEEPRETPFMGEDR